MNTSSELEVMAEEFRARSLAVVIIETIGTAAICLLAAIGNLFTLLIIYKNPALRTPTNLLIVSLALSDFALATFGGIPIFCPTVAASRFPFPDALCQYAGFLIIVLITASMQTIAWTSFNRFCRVVKPAQYKVFFSKRRTLFIIAFIWGISITAPIPYMSQGRPFVFHPAKGICFLPIKLDTLSTTLIFVHTGYPTIITYYCYLRVFLRVRQHNARLSQASAVSTEEIRITRTLCVIVVFFMICWTPILVVEAVDYAHGRWVMPRWVYLLYSVLGLGSSSVNPLIYVVMNRQFRGEYLRIFRCCSPKRNTVRHFAVATIS